MDAVRLALAAERRLPRLARVYAGRESAAATRTVHEFGVVWRGGSRAQRPVVVHLAERPETAGWFASRLAARLGAVVLVPDSLETPYRTLVRAYFDAKEWRADGTRLALIGDGAGATAALLAAIDARDERRPSIERVTLLRPQSLPSVEVTNLPPTLVVAGADSLPTAEALEHNLRTAGVWTELSTRPALPAFWSTRPVLVPEADDVLAEVADFTGRGFGLESTFGVRRTAQPR